MSEKGKVWTIILILLTAFWSAVGLVVVKLAEVL